MGPVQDAQRLERKFLKGATDRGGGLPEIRRLLGPAGASVDWCWKGSGVDRELASCLDHTLLDPTATQRQICQLCLEAAAYCFKSVCVAPLWVSTASALLSGAPVGVCSVVGFPFGNSTTEIKSREATMVIVDGASEVDMVICLGALKSGDWFAVARDIGAVVRVCRQADAICKVIIETACLTESEKRRACQVAVEEGAHFVKTSTGFGGGGATIEDVALMKGVVGTRADVKASGGVRTAAWARRLLQAGATRIGTSAGVQIVGGEPIEMGDQEDGSNGKGTEV